MNQTEHKTVPAAKGADAEKLEKRIELPEAVASILCALEKAGYEGYAVGGCVRDALLGREPNDWDITTSATPQQVKEIFPRTIDTGIKHGTVTIMKNHTGYEVTTYRIDGVYEDGRHPKQVTFTPSLSEDLARRDFTINAMAYNEREGLVDLFGGREDMEKRRIRAVGDPRERFSEDALRMMRAVRFAAQLGYEIEENTKEAILSLSQNLEKISAERIQTELVKLLVSPHPEKLRLFYETGLTKIFLPEFDRAMETEQHNPHHQYTVGVHTLVGLCNAQPDKVQRLTLLFHDLGKPFCQSMGEDGYHHFHGHPKLSAEIAEKRMRALKFDNATRERVCALILEHDIRPEPTSKAVRRLAAKHDVSFCRQLFAVMRADLLAQSTYMREEKLARLSALEGLLSEAEAAENCLSMKDLAVGGADLIGLGYPAGPRLGEELQRLLALVVDDPSRNEKEQLLKKAAEDLQH